MRKEIIQIDVDSTLYDADPLFSKIAKENGIQWIDKAMTWFTPEEIGATKEDVKKIFRIAHSKEIVSQNDPYPDAAEAITHIGNSFKDLVEIYYVSDRNAQQSSALSMWLEDNGFFDSEAVSGVIVSRDKREWMRQNEPLVVIDDRVRTLLHARFNLNAYCFAIKHNHNINLTKEVEDIYIADNWKILGKELNGLLMDLQRKRSLYGNRENLRNTSTD